MPSILRVVETPDSPPDTATVDIDDLTLLQIREILLEVCRSNPDALSGATARVLGKKCLVVDRRHGHSDDNVQDSDDDVTPKTKKGKKNNPKMSLTRETRQVDVGLSESVPKARVGIAATIWEKRFQELRQYHAQHGDCKVPQKYKPNPQIGRWVTYQRAEYQKMAEGKPSHMTAAKVAALNEIGFVWKVDLWAQRFEELRQYKAQHGNANVPRSYEPNPQLAPWVMTQRTQYRFMQEGKPSHMTQERIAALEDLGFAWSAYEPRSYNPTKKASSEDRLEELRLTI